MDKEEKTNQKKYLSEKKMKEGYIHNDLLLKATMLEYLQLL